LSGVCGAAIGPELTPVESRVAARRDNDIGLVTGCGGRKTGLR
jgi:hypothetical protein